VYAIFIESPIFTEDVKRSLSDEEYAALQLYLVRWPEAGKLISNTGGLRKIRWAARGRGKRGGMRIIYFYAAGRAEIRMILIYRKGIKDDLTSGEKSALRKLNREWSP
jgi:hypothetical protein